MSDDKIVKLMEQQSQMMDFMAKLLQNQETRKTDQQASTTRAALMESLTNSMTDFVYEPESGLIFQAWYNRYVHVFEREAITLEEQDRVALLWRKMSDRIHERFKNYVLPQKPSEMTLKETVETLNKLFGRIHTEVSQRYKCLQLKKGIMKTSVNTPAK